MMVVGRLHAGAGGLLQDGRHARGDGLGRLAKEALAACSTLIT
jgi:hypothetical protein